MPMNSCLELLEWASYLYVAELLDLMELNVASWLPSSSMVTACSPQSTDMQSRDSRRCHESGL